MKTVRILLADDHDVVRIGTRILLTREPGWEICGEAETGRKAVQMAEKLKPDIVVLDMAMPELNGLEASRQIKRLLPETELLIFTAHENEDLVHEVFAAGVRSYILKHEATQHLVPAIKALCQHKPYFTGKTSAIIFARYLHGGEKSPPGQSLTARERETVQLIAEGRSNKEVAAVLGLSVKTIETHRASIMRKLGLPSATELVRYAIRNKIIEA